MKKTTKSLASLLIVAAMLISLIPTSLVTLASADTTVAKLELESDFTCLNGSSRHDPMTFLEESCLRARGNQERAEFTAPSAGTYTFTLRAGSLYNAYIVGLQVDGNSVGNYTVTANRSTLNDFALSTTLSAGSHTVVLDFADEYNGAADYLLITTNAGGGGDTDTSSSSDTSTAEVEIGSLSYSANWSWGQHTLGSMDFSGYTDVRFVVSSTQGEFNKIYINGTEYYVGNNTSLNGKLDGTESYPNVSGQSSVSFGYEGHANMTMTFYGVSAAADSYTVTMGTISNGTVTVDGNAVSSGDTTDVDSGDSITLVATPASGYEFAGWSTNGGSSYVSTDATWNYTPNTNATITPVFTKDSTGGETGGEVTIIHEGSNSLSRWNYFACNGVQSVPTAVEGGTLTVEYNGSDNTQFKFIANKSGWDDSEAIYTFFDNMPTGTQSYQITLTAEQAEKMVDAGGFYFSGQNVTITKVYYTAPGGSEETTTYTVTVEAGEGGTANVDGKTSVTVTEGTEVTVTATPNDGYAFEKWSNGNTNASYTFTVTEDVTLTASFVEVIKEYTVTIGSTNGGTATVNGGSSATVEEGTSVDLIATPIAGYTFKGWQIGNNTVTDNPYSYEVTGDITITPIFTPNKVTVSVIADNGTVTGAGIYDYGTQATLKVTADDGYRFTGWYVAGERVSTSTTYTFDVPLTDVTVTAEFAEIVKYTVAVTPNNADYGSVTGGGVFETGTEVTVTATVASDAYKFLGWYEGDTLVSSNVTYTFLASANRTLVARFAEIVKYTVTVESANTAQGTVTGGGTFEEGTSVTVKATANTGYAFKGWYVNGLEVSNNASYTFDVTGNITLTATFEEATTTDTIRLEGENATRKGDVTVAIPNENVTVDSTSEGLVALFGDASDERIASFDVEIPVDGKYTFTFRAVGLGSESRKMQFFIDDDYSEESVSNSGWTDFVYEVKLTAGTHTIGAKTVNWGGDDSWRWEWLYFDYVEIKAEEPVFEYVAPSYTVNATVDGNGTVAVTPEQDTFEQGSKVTVTVTPVEGYSVAYWIVNGKQVSSTSNTYTIEAIDRNYTIEAKLTNTYKVTTTVKAADKEHPYAFAEIELPESVFPQLYVEENWKNGFNITCAYNLTHYIFNGKAEAVFAVKTSSGKYYYQQSTHNLANTTITIPNCWYDPDDKVVSVILLVTAISPAQNDFLENGDALVDLRMDFTVYDVVTRDTPYVDLSNKTDNYIIYGNEIPVMDADKPSDWQNNNGDSWVTFETVIDDLNEFEHRVWEIEYEFDRSNQDEDDGGTTGGVYAGRYYIVPDGDVHVDATGGSGFSFYYRTEVSNTEGIWITLQSNLFSTHEADDEGREPMKVYLEPTGGEWEACFVAYDLSRADGEYITYWDFFVDGSNSCVEANGTYTYVDPKVYGDDYITKMSADSGTFWFTELRLERYSNIIIEYKDMFGKVIEHRTDKVATIQDPPDFIERKGYDFLYWTYNGKIVGEYWTDDATGEYVTPGTEGATKYDTGHFELPVTESRIYVAMYQYNGELYNITVTNGAITNVSTKPVEEDQCRYETVLLLEASKDTPADFAYWVYGDYDVDAEGKKIAGTEKYSIISYKESFYTSVMGHADYIAVYKDDIDAKAEFVPESLLAYYSPDKTGNGATYFTSAADMKLYTSIFNRAEVFDSYHDKQHNKISFLGTIAYDEDTFKPLGWGTVVTNSEAAANTVGNADQTLLEGGKTSDEMVITYENFLSATWYWTNVGTSKATIQKTSWTRTDVWDVILAGGQYLMSYTNLNNGIVRYARTFLVAEEIATGAVYMVYSDDQTKGEISAKPATVNINVAIKIDGAIVETTTNGRVVKDEKSGCYTTGSGSVITTAEGFVRATPAVGYNFLGWDTNGDGNADITSTKYEYSKLKENVNLVALFKKTSTIYVTATVATANAGRIASSVTNNQITAGESVTLYALPNAGFKFLGWYVSDKDVGISYVPTTYTSTDASYTFRPTEDCYAYAYFVEGTNVKTYTVTIGEAVGGSATVDGETSKAVEYGTKVTLVATPNKGYEFAYWMINSVNGSTESTIEYVVSKNVTITPVFHKSTYGYTDTLTLEAEDYTDAKYDLSGTALKTGTDNDITYTVLNNSGAKDVQVVPFTAPTDGKYTVTYYYQRTKNSEIHFDIFTTSSSDLAQMTIDGVTYYETYYNGKYSNIGKATDEYDNVSAGTWGVKEFPMTLDLKAGETILIGLCDNNGNANFDKVVVKADAKVFEEGLKPTVTIVATNGTVTDADGATVETGKYSVGAELELYPVQNSADYIFSHWADAKGNVLSTDVCYTFTVEADTTVEAVFEAYTSVQSDANAHDKTPAGETVYNVTVGVQNGNTVIVKNYFTGDKANNLANYEGYYLDTITGESVTFTVVDRKLTLTAVDKVVADGEYNIFLGWKVNGVLQSGTTDENGNHEFKTEKLSKYDSLEIIAVYSAEELKEYTVTVESSNGSVLDADDNVITSVNGYAGSSATLFAAPEVGYIFSHWELDGVNVGTAIPYSVTITDNSTLVAVFTEYVSIETNANAHVNKDANQSYYNLTVSVENGNSAVVKNYYSTSAEGYYLDTITSATGTVVEVPADRKVTLTAVDKVVTDGSVNIFVGWYQDGVLLSTDRVCQVAKRSTATTVVAKYSTVTSLDVTINYLGASEITYNGSKDTSFTIDAPVNGTTYTFTVGDAANYYEFLGWYAGETLLGTDKTLNYTYNSSNGSVEIVAKYDFVSVDTMPIISIVTSNQDVTNADPQNSGFNAITDSYVDATVSVLNGDAYGSYSLTDATAEVKGRGNSTWSSAEKNNLKRPIRIKFAKKEKQDLLNLNGTEMRNWVLLANNIDRSMYRNALAFELGNALNGIAYTSKWSNVEVYINGVYQGVYLLCEQSEADPDRNNINEPEDGSNVEIDAFIELDNKQNHKNNGETPDVVFDGATYDDGDYYFTAEKNGTYSFTTYQDPVFTIKSDIFTIEQYNYLKTTIRGIQNTIYNGSESEIRAAINVESFVDMYILQEIAKNIDVGYSSFYMMLKGGVLYLTNPWDFDKAFGDDDRADSTTGLYVGEKEGADDSTNYNPWFVALLDKSWFKDLVEARWTALYDAGTFTTVAETIKADYNSKAASLARNWTMWKDKMDDKLDNEPSAVLNYSSHKQAFDGLMSWYEARIAYINSQYYTNGGSTGGEGGEGGETPDGETVEIYAIVDGNINATHINGTATPESLATDDDIINAGKSGDENRIGYGIAIEIPELADGQVVTVDLYARGKANWGAYYLVWASNDSSNEYKGATGTGKADDNWSEDNWNLTKTDVATTITFDSNTPAGTYYVGILANYMNFYKVVVTYPSAS